MSIWYCQLHGLTGPEACCGAAGLAKINALLGDQKQLTSEQARSLYDFTFSEMKNDSTQLSEGEILRNRFYEIAVAPRSCIRWDELSVDEKIFWTRCASVFQEIEERQKPKWSKNIPDDSGFWWWWEGVGIYCKCPPLPVRIAFDGLTGTYFALAGQLGWESPQKLLDMGGYWMRCTEPATPSGKH